MKKSKKTKISGRYILRKRSIKKILNSTNVNKKNVKSTKEQEKISITSTKNEQLLDDIYCIVISVKAKKMRTKRLINLLCSVADREWATFNSGKGIGAKQLGAALKEFDVHSKDFRFKKGVFKGYAKKDIIRAARRLKIQ